MKKINIYIILSILLLLQFSCSIRRFDCNKGNYLFLVESTSKDGKLVGHIDVIYDSNVMESFSIDQRVILKKMNLNKKQKVLVVREFLCFKNKVEISDKSYSNRFGRITNRIKIIRENIKYPIQVEALYSLTTLLFDEDVLISPVIINRRTGMNCNFQKEDIDKVYKIYNSWFRKMEKENFERITWPLKNSDYMWLGEDIVDDIETLIKKDL